MDKVQDSIQNLINIGNLVDESIVKASIFNPVKSSIDNSIKDCIKKEYNKESLTRN